MPGTTPPGPITDSLQWVSSSQIQNSDFLGLPISNCYDGGPHGLECPTGFFPSLVPQRSPGFLEFRVLNFRSKFRSRQPRAKEALFYASLLAACHQARYQAGTIRVVKKRHRPKFWYTLGTREIPWCSAISMPKKCAMSPIITHWIVSK